MVKGFAGSNNYLLKQSVKELKDNFSQNYGELAVEEIDCEEIEPKKLVNALQSTPLFAAKKLVIAKNISLNKQLSEQIEEILGFAKGGNELVIVESNLDKRSAFYKSLKNHTTLKEFGEPEENGLADWLVAEAKQNNARLSRQDAYYLIGRVQGSQQRLSMELKKLIDHNKDISRESIDELTDEAPSESIFNLLDAAFAGDGKRVLKIYRQERAKGSEPRIIFAMAVWQANLLALAASAPGKTTAEIAKTAGLKPYPVEKSQRIFRRIGHEGLSELLDKLVKTDKLLKTRAADGDELVKNLFFSLGTLARLG